MKTTIGFAGILCALIGSSAFASMPVLHERTLPNGMQLSYLYVKDSRHIAIFTYLPIGLAFDDADHAQWSHLLEHLIIRTTVPPGQPLTTINAETLPDHMRLDFYDVKENWREGLAHHVKWLSNLPISDEAIRVEPGNANREADHTAKGLATHKFAIAAWDQVCRHNRDHAAIKADLLKATRADLESYRAARLPRPAETFLCIIGGIDPETFLIAAGESLSTIRAPVTQPPATTLPVMKPGTHTATWDLSARHLVLTWPIPSPKQDLQSHAALSILSRLLMFQFAQDPALQKTLGPILISASDLRCPESDYFCISAPLRAGTDFSAARALLLSRLSTLSTAKDSPLPLDQLSQLLIDELELHDPAQWRAQAPPQMTDAMLEAQVALTWGTYQYRLGRHCQKFQQALGGITLDQIQEAITTHLTPDLCTTLELTQKN